MNHFKRINKFKLILFSILVSLIFCFLFEGLNYVYAISYIKKNLFIRWTLALILSIIFCILVINKQSKTYKLLDNIDTCILIIDPTGKIYYTNNEFNNIFKKISTWLPIKTIEEISSYSYFDFYLNPDEQKQLFQNKNNFPFEFVLDIGSEIISTYAVPLFKNNHSNKIMVTWRIITRERNQMRWEKVVEQQIETTVGELKTASDELMTSSIKVKDIAENNSGQAQDVASFSREVTQLILKLSDAVTQSSSKIHVIAKNVENSKVTTEKALNETQETRKIVMDLNEMASTISKMTESIQEIMAQTHVLALNANIEAVRAGDSGKGFAAIANQVSSLAKQTASTSEEITEVVTHILEKIPLSVASIETVETIVKKMNTLTLSIHDLMFEQTEMMGTMNSHMNVANQNSDQITQRMDEVVSHSSNTLLQLEKTRKAVKNIENISELFNLIISRFGEERIVTLSDIFHMLITIQQLIDAWMETHLTQDEYQRLKEIPLEAFKGQKPANVLKTSIASYEILLRIKRLPQEDILFPKGIVTPTQAYNFLSKMLEKIESILKTENYQDIQSLKNARPVAGKTPNDAYAVTHRINLKLKTFENKITKLN